MGVCQLLIKKIHMFLDKVVEINLVYLCRCIILAENGTFKHFPAIFIDADVHWKMDQ